MDRRIYAVDIGSTRSEPGRSSNFAWARVDPATPALVAASSDIEGLAKSVVADLVAHRHVALGFEAPLFMPVPDLASDLSRGRAHEGSRSFAAPAGLAVAALGVHQAAWILRQVRKGCESVQLETDPAAWPPSREGPILFCWEAFVSGTAHSDSHLSDCHLKDAATAVLGFLENEHDLRAATTVRAENPLSLFGAVALWSGFTTDIGVLHGQTVVIRPAAAYAGEIQAASPPHASGGRGP